jgi:(E)-4-hydroxy-3-methylbut-2-enyl-diphosphate synthase
LKDAGIVDHLVELIEKKAAEIEAAKTAGKAEEADRHRAAAE